MAKKKQPAICQQTVCPHPNKTYNWVKTQYECPYRDYDFEQETYVCVHPRIK